MAEDAQGQTPKYQTDQSLASAAGENWDHHADINSVADAPLAEKSNFPLPHPHNRNANQKAESGFLTPRNPEGAILAAKVMRGVASGSLRFALLENFHGGVEIWRAADASDPRNCHADDGKPAPAQKSLLVGVEDACRLLGGISRPTLWRLVKKGRINQVQIGVTRALFSRNQIERYVNKATEAAAKASWRP